MTVSPTLAQVVALWEARYPPEGAAQWDRVGLVTGDLGQYVRYVRLAVDPTPEVVDQAVADGIDLLVTHHPLLLRGVHGVATTTAKGRVITTLVRAGVALLTAHTNADVAVGGVNDALADAVGMTGARRPIQPLSGPETARVVVYVPAENADALVAALADSGAGTIGNYDRCAYWVDGTGQFRPLTGALPHVGAVGTLERVAERRIEMVLPRESVDAVVAALRSAHPYEEPAFHVVANVPLAGAAGMGRYGPVSPTTLAGLAERLAGALPANAQGVRVAGPPDTPISTVAVCGGSGDGLLPHVTRLGVDAYVTSDLRHHPASDARVGGGPCLLDIAHAAGESLWLAAAARDLTERCAAEGWTVAASASDLNTDPWTFRVPTEGVA